MKIGWGIICILLFQAAYLFHIEASITGVLESSIAIMLAMLCLMGLLPLKRKIKPRHPHLSIVRA